jgi:hypothetical protein
MSPKKILALNLIYLSFFAMAAETPSQLEMVPKMIEKIRQASDLRSQLSIEDQRWKEEQQRLEISVQAQKQGVINLEKEILRLTEIRDQLVREIPSLSQTESLSIALDRAAQKLKLRLQEIEKHAMPGLVEWTTDPNSNDTFLTLSTTVQQIEHANGRFAILTIEGDLGGQPRIVRALRAGAACAWWVSLDGKQAGAIQVADGRAHLIEDANPTTRHAIVQAMDRVEGRGTPGLIKIPLHFTEKVHP